MGCMESGVAGVKQNAGQVGSTPATSTSKRALIPAGISALFVFVPCMCLAPALGVIPGFENEDRYQASCYK